MANQVAIPQLGWEMSEGTLVGWLVDDGAAVSVGDPLYVLETDKVQTEIQAPWSGVLRTIGVPEQVYDVGAVIAEIT